MPPIEKKITRDQFDPEYCQAYNRKGYQCGNKPLGDKAVCGLHGGKSLGGLASPVFKHGRYSKYVPSNLLEKYNQAADDPDLLSLRDEIRIVDARIMEELELLSDNESHQDWQTLGTTWDRLVNAQNSGNTDRANQLLQDVHRLIQEGRHAPPRRELWANYDDLVETRRKLVTTEARRLAEMNQLITAERAMTLVYAVVGIVRDNIQKYINEKQVADDGLFRTISEDIRRLTSQRTG